MEQLRFSGRGAVCWLGTPYAPTHTQANSRKAGSAATGAELKQTSEVSGHMCGR